VGAAWALRGRVAAAAAAGLWALAAARVLVLPAAVGGAPARAHQPATAALRSVAELEVQAAMRSFVPAADEWLRFGGEATPMGFSSNQTALPLSPLPGAGHLRAVFGALAQVVGGLEALPPPAPFAAAGAAGALACVPEPPPAALAAKALACAADPAHYALGARLVAQALARLTVEAASICGAGALPAALRATVRVRCAQQPEH
jgi:hypothetical protein